MKHIILGAGYMEKSYSVNMAGMCTKKQPGITLNFCMKSPDRGWFFQNKLWILVKAASH